MALVVKDRVKETTTTTGTGTITLAGAVSGFQSFSVIGNGNTAYYAIIGTGEWEVGIGTYSTTGPTLARTTVLESSNSNALVNFSAGTKDVFVTYSADKSVYVQPNGGVSIGTTDDFGDNRLVVMGAILARGGDGAVDVPVIASQITPYTFSASATIPMGATKYGLINATTPNVAKTLTLPTGTNMDAGILGGSMPVDTAWDWSIVGTATAASTVTVAANTGHTVLGNMVVSGNVSAMFRTRKTATNTFVTYRIG